MHRLPVRKAASCITLETWFTADNLSHFATEWSAATTPIQRQQLPAAPMQLLTQPDYYWQVAVVVWV